MITRLDVPSGAFGDGKCYSRRDSGCHPGAPGAPIRMASRPFAQVSGDLSIPDPATALAHVTRPRDGTPNRPLSAEGEERRERHHDRRRPRREYGKVPGLPPLDGEERGPAELEPRREPGGPGEVHEQDEVQPERGEPVGREAELADAGD